jgi:hypothetical protein
MVVALGVVVSVSVAAQNPPQQNWTGKISDSNCKEKHAAAEHDGKKMTEAECTSMCVKKGAKYVFVSDGKVYQLANQKSKTIASHAGQEVQTDGVDEGRHDHGDEDHDPGAGQAGEVRAVFAVPHSVSDR